MRICEPWVAIGGGCRRFIGVRAVWNDVRGISARVSLLLVLHPSLQSTRAPSEGAHGESVQSWGKGVERALSRCSFIFKRALRFFCWDHVSVFHIPSVVVLGCIVFELLLVSVALGGWRWISGLLAIQDLVCCVEDGYVLGTLILFVAGAVFKFVSVVEW